MTVDDAIITNAIDYLNTEIDSKQLEVNKLRNLHDDFTSIQKFKQRVNNQKGGYDVVTVVPNIHRLSDADIIKVRQIIYDDCKAKYDILNPP